jgi:hypothetical protein
MEISVEFSFVNKNVWSLPLYSGNSRIIVTRQALIAFLSLSSKICHLVYKISVKPALT